MIFAALLACATPSSLEGDWSVDELEFDSVTAEDAFGPDWSGTATIQPGGVGVLAVSGPRYDMNVTLTADETDDGAWHLTGKTSGMLYLDMSCALDGGGASCIDRGTVDWSHEDSDSYVVLLTLTPA